MSSSFVCLFVCPTPQLQIVDSFFLLVDVDVDVDVEVDVGVGVGVGVGVVVGVGADVVL